METKKAILDFEMSTFHVPPSGDILVLAKNCPIGPMAAIKMLESVAPDKFELITIEDDVIEAILIMKYLFLRIEKEKLVKTIIQEAKTIMGTSCMINIRCNITIKGSLEIQV